MKLLKSHPLTRLKCLCPNPRQFRRNPSAKRKMLTLPKIDRRGFLALWAQDRRRKRVRGALPTLLPAPVLHAAYPDLLQWDWNLPNPFKWNVWMSLDGGVSWMLIEDYWMYGDARQFAPDGGSEFYFIVGVDAAGVEITERSNWIRPDDAVPPVPQSVFGLQLWTRVESLAALADGDPVASWTDESGHETHLAQSTFGSQPVYRTNAIGQPSLYFDGTDDLLTSVASVFKPDQHTIFVVAMPLATGENDILGTGGTGDGDALLMLYSNHLRGHAWRGSDSNELDGSTAIHASTLAVFEQTVSDTDITLRLDGSVEAWLGISGTPANTRKWVTLGSRSTGTNFSGHILAVLVYDRALTDSEANTIRQYLIDTYAVAVPYPPPVLTLHDSLVAYWAMESSDTSEPDLSGNWNYLQSDSSPKIAGFMGAAYDAGGDTGGWAPGMTCVGYPLDGVENYSFSLWVSGNMPTEGALLSAGNLFVVKGWNQGGSMQDITVHPYDGDTNSINMGLAWGYSPESWSHVVITKSATLFCFYFNGSLVGWADVSAFPYYSLVDQIAIGTGGSGLIDEVGCWQRVLSPADVAQLYNYGSGLPFENF